MRALTFASGTVLLLAAFFPESAAVFVAAGAVTLSLFFLVGRDDGVLLTPLVLAGPFFARFFFAPTSIRVVFLVLIGLLIRWALVDVDARRRGAPLVLERLTFFFLAGSFFLFATAFVAASTVGISPSLLLGGVSFLAASGMFVLHTVAVRARAASVREASVVLDAILVGLLLTEVFVVLSFLPFSPLTLGAALVVLFWAIIVVLIASRVQGSASGEVLRAGLVTAAVLVVLFFSVPWSPFFR